MRGDRILYGQVSGVVDFLADPLSVDPESIWYLKEFGHGIMISQLENMGSVFVSEPETDEDLQFVSRTMA